MLLLVSGGNFWTSKPVGGTRIEMILMPTRAVGVADLGAAVVFLVISIATRTAPTPSRGHPTRSAGSSSWPRVKIALGELI